MPLRDRILHFWTIRAPSAVKMDIAPHIRIQTIAQLGRGASWRLNMLHDRPQHLLLWVTKGQGLATVRGRRRGVGVHNALFLPANTLFSLDLGAQGFGQALTFPASTPIPLPRGPMHLRVRDVSAQSELTGLIEAMQREVSAARPHMGEALDAYGALVGVWLRRHAVGDGSGLPDEKASDRLVGRFADMVAQEFRSGRPMADYATALDVTPTHLSRVCRERLGRTASDILTERVVYEARLLLTGTELPIQDIARHLGFSSPAYFTRFVQHHTGAPPSALRRGGRPATAGTKAR